VAIFLFLFIYFFLEFFLEFFLQVFVNQILISLAQHGSLSEKLWEVFIFFLFLRLVVDAYRVSVTYSDEYYKSLNFDLLSGMMLSKGAKRIGVGIYLRRRAASVHVAYQPGGSRYVHTSVNLHLYADDRLHISNHRVRYGH